MSIVDQTLKLGLVTLVLFRAGETHDGDGSVSISANNSLER
jgi:hypothetical protein